MRIGMGYDVHQLVEGRELILGGINIPFEKGLLGHSDADVLTHALMDALLGACAMGDIGTLFPDNDNKYKNADSLVLLTEVNRRIVEGGFVIGNVDMTIIAQKPKLSPYREEMIKKIASVLNIEIKQINIKMTTEEGLGFTGSGEGISAQAIALLYELSDMTSYLAASSDKMGCEGCTGCAKKQG